MWVLTLHKDALEFLLIIFNGKSPSGHLGSAPCPAPWFSLLITTSGAAETMLFSPGLAGGMWVSNELEECSRGEALGLACGAGAELPG